MTKTMTVEFIKPILIDQEMKAEGRALDRKNDREAIIEGFIYNDDKITNQGLMRFLCSNTAGENYGSNDAGLPRDGILEAEIRFGVTPGQACCPGENKIIFRLFFSAAASSGIR